ncbi:MAG: hypothetical protein ABI479_03045 [Gallionella sp.]
MKRNIRRNARWLLRRELKMVENYEDYISRVRGEDLFSILRATVEKGIHGQFHEEFGKFLFNLKLPPSLLF